MKTLKRSWFIPVGISVVILLLAGLLTMAPAFAQGPDEMMWGNGYGYGMMGGGMMPGNNAFVKPDPLTLAEATAAVEAYLTNMGDENLALGEVMVFDNHAYAQIVEQGSGIGALEVLVDPVTKAVYPEIGPNMM